MENQQNSQFNASQYYQNKGFQHFKSQLQQEYKIAYQTHDKFLDHEKKIEIQNKIKNHQDKIIIRTGTLSFDKELVALINPNKVTKKISEQMRLLKRSQEFNKSENIDYMQLCEEKEYQLIGKKIAMERLNHSQSIEGDQQFKQNELCKIKTMMKQSKFIQGQQNQLSQLLKNIDQLNQSTKQKRNKLFSLKYLNNHSQTINQQCNRESQLKTQQSEKRTQIYYPSQQRQRIKTNQDTVEKQEKKEIKTDDKGKIKTIQDQCMSLLDVSKSDLKNILNQKKTYESELCQVLSITKQEAKEKIKSINQLFSKQLKTKIQERQRATIFGMVNDIKNGSFDCN